MFDSGGSTGHLRACPFLGTWRALFCGELFVWALDGTGGRSVFDRRITSEHHLPGEGQANRLRRTYFGRSLFSPQPAGFNIPCRQLTARGYANYENERVREHHGARSLMARNFTEQLGGNYDLEPRGSAVS